MISFPTKARQLAPPDRRAEVRHEMTRAINSRLRNWPRGWWVQVSDDCINATVLGEHGLPVRETGLRQFLRENEMEDLAVILNRLPQSDVSHWIV